MVAEGIFVCLEWNVTRNQCLFTLQKFGNTKDTRTQLVCRYWLITNESSKSITFDKYKLQKSESVCFVVMIGKKKGVEDLRRRRRFNLLMKFNIWYW